jgi:plastocyanin
MQIAGTFQAAMPTRAGVYAYQCNHPSEMNGTVTVQ